MVLLTGKASSFLKKINRFVWLFEGESQSLNRIPDPNP
jgi:hypothetical protein